MPTERINNLEETDYEELVENMLDAHAEYMYEISESNHPAPTYKRVFEEKKQNVITLFEDMVIEINELRIKLMENENN